ncbi:MAG: hypothetical protein A4S15_12685 [Candidatus Raskinella chloraquaticus]|uniref:Uncharacterized protein n=1 Tax=Candidatus Raskinella chloraquaticus TaxID=1951219 RepID=A0A1W9HUC7_9HYPH|nr:MAG: hypothetical protein A4S15_12685 [Proteobacteria bacterium SG_bin8]
MTSFVPTCKGGRLFQSLTGIGDGACDHQVACARFDDNRAGCHQKMRRGFISRASGVVTT